MKITLAMLSLIILNISLLSGCHTAQGFGKDVQHTGQAIQRTVSH